MTHPLALKHNSIVGSKFHGWSNPGLPGYSGLLYKSPVVGGGRLSHCRATVRLTVRGGPSWSTTAHSRGILLFTAGGRCTGRKEEKCGRCSVSEGGAALHVRPFSVSCRRSLAVPPLEAVHG